MSDLLLSEDAFIVPTCVVGVKPHCFDMRKIHTAEARLVELSGVTKAKAGELLACFITAYDDARKFRAILRGELIRSKQRVKSVAGRVTLDEAASILKEKGLLNTRSPAGSEDLRKAVVDTHADYIAAVDLQAQVEASLDHMDGKVEKMHMAYFSVQELQKGPEMSKHISGGVGEDSDLTSRERAQVFAEEHSTVKKVSYSSGFGAPKF
jgi:hypothetical protein